MRTRNFFYPNNSSITILRRRNKRHAQNVVEPELRTIVEIAPIADNQTMEELLQAPTEGYGEAIVIPEFNADHFEIKMNLLQLVQANRYHGFERENPHTYINNFKRITSTLKFKDVPNDVIKLMMFPYSLEGATRVWMNTTSRENASKTDDRIDKLADQISTLVDVVSKNVVTPATVKAVEESCVTCGGNHAYYNCDATNSNQSSVFVATGTYNQVAPQNHASNHMAPPGFVLVQTIVKLGVTKDVFVKVGKFHFPTDFVVVDFESDPRVPLILGRSFLRIGRALIEVYGEEITLRVNDEAVTLIPIKLRDTLLYMMIYFMGPFPSLRGNRYILVAVDYLSKWAEAKVLPTNDALVVVRFLKSLFAQFGTPRAIISDRGTHFCNDKFAKIMSKTIGEDCASWSKKLEDAFWAFRTAYKTPVGCTPYKERDAPIATNARQSKGKLHGIFLTTSVTPQGTMLLNLDQLEKQLDKEKFQEIRSVDAFRVLKFQTFMNTRFSFDDDDGLMIRKYFLAYTRDEVQQLWDTLIQHMKSIKKLINERAQHRQEYDSICMRTRNFFYPNNSSVTISRRRNKRHAQNVVEPELRTIVEIAPIADNRTMEELLQAPTEGYGEAIVIPEFNADHMAPPDFVPVQTIVKLDKEQTNFQGSTTHIQPPVAPISKPDVPKTLHRPNIPYPLRLNDQKLHEKSTNQMQKFFQIFQDFHFDISFADALLLMPKFASTGKSLLENKDKLFELAKIPLNENCSVPEKLGDPDKFLIPSNRSITHPKGVTKDVFVKVGKFHFPTDFVVVDFESDPRVPLILGRSFLRIGRALIEVYGEEITLRVNDEVVTFNPNQTTRYSSIYDDMSVNRIDVIDVAREEIAQEMLGFSKNSLSANPTSTSEPIIFDSSHSLTPFEGSDFILEEIKAYLKDESISSKIDHVDCDPKGEICLTEKFVK
nr:reverse transcriptase domain-containing protein [Tanacetum cinerariifolium]